MLYSWLLCIVKKKLFNQWAAQAKLLSSLCFFQLMKNGQKKKQKEDK